MPVRVLELLVTDRTEDKLWEHGLTLADALDLLEADFRTFADFRHAGRRLMIGRDRSGRLITLVIEPADTDGACFIITGWQSSTAEATLFARPGGTQHAGRATTTD